MFIGDTQTCKLLRQFCSIGISLEDLRQLKVMLQKFSPCLHLLLEYLNVTPTNDAESLSCPLPWVELLRSLACASPVCALVRPNQEVFTLLKDVATDPEKARHCSATMASLQKEIPVLFTLISSQPTTSSRILSSIVDELVRKSNAPFVTDSFNETSSLKREHVESKSSF